jgi:putative membrane protein
MTGETEPNTAPVDHGKRGSEYLANERTFLAWIRTSVAVISLGFLVDRFGLFLRELESAEKIPTHHSYVLSSFLVGDFMMGLGAILAMLAAWRYHAVNASIERGEAKADRSLIIAVTVLVVLLAVAMILVAQPR